MKILAFILVFTTCITCFGQEISLSEQLKNNSIKVLNRQIQEYEVDGVELDANKGNGLAILDAVDFKNGTIYIEIKGENTPGKSFVGLAFNVQNDSTYEAIYFRPFNFNADEPARRSHMVQYISHPIYTWNKLRQERTDEFEAELKTPPSPEDWFLAKIKLTADKVIVYLNKEIEPVFEAKRLTDQKAAKIALWTGHESSGRFRNLVILSNQ